MRVSDLGWALPLVAVTGGAIAGDTRIERQLPDDPALIHRSNTMANYGVVAASGLLAGTYLFGKLGHDDRLSQTAWMAGEAAISSLIPAFVIKTATQRARPPDARHTGFWQGGDSFPSEHSAAAWSIASVFAHEYPGLGTELLAYGAASAMSASRVLGRKHFTSDVILGSTLGWWFGRQVYRSHRDPEQDTSIWGNFVSSDRESSRDSESMGSTYVPLDSWVYPALDRLAALGYAPTAFAGLRPWTRMECARLLEEMEGQLDGSGDFGEAGRLYKALKMEFEPDRAIHTGLDFGVESIYSRFSGIAGTPLQDGYHFSRTIVNDYGRPFAEGLNVASGISGWAGIGPLSFYVRGEYQRAPGVPDPIERPAAQTPADEFGVSFLPPHVPIPGISRLELLDTYVSLTHGGWNLSFGRQSLSWGPGRGGAFLWSDNAEPVVMLRFARTTPLKLPWIFGWLGPVRAESLLGRLEGQQFVETPTGPVGTFGISLSQQPYVYAQKFSFKPTPNLEFGFSRSGLFGGPGFPVTLRSFGRALFATSTQNGRNDAGDRRTAFDFSYRLPGLRKWVVLYNDSMAEDEYSPIAYPRRSAMRPGLYFPQIPKLHRVDFRVEAPYTDLPGLRHKGYFYWNLRYLDGYTNDGNILGSWVGRQGWGIQAWSTVWLSGRSTLEFGYRTHRVSSEFLEGGNLTDGSTRADLALGKQWRLTLAGQYERWNFPLLASQPMSNLAISAQLTFYPKFGVR
jgi:hypothetical protein